MAPRQAHFDALLASHQPVHSRVQLILVDCAEPEHVPEGGDGAFRVQTASGGQFGAGVDDPSNDHGDDQIALAGGGTSDKGMEAEIPEGAEDGRDMAVRGAANDGQQVVGRAESETAVEEDTQALDDVRGTLGEVGDGTFLDFAVLAEGLTEEDGRGRVAVRNGVDVHGHLPRGVVE